MHLTPDQILTIIAICVQCLIAGIIVCYTRITYGLLRNTADQLALQQRQFEFSNRPWLYIGDVIVENVQANADYSLEVINLGRLPAIFEISVDGIEYEENQKYCRITTLDRATCTVFPTVDKLVGPIRIQLKRIEENSTIFLSATRRIELNVSIKYGMIGGGLLFSTALNVQVPNVERSERQVTLLFQTLAT